MKKNLTLLALITAMPLFISTVWTCDAIEDDKDSDIQAKSRRGCGCFSIFSKKKSSTRQTRAETDATISTPIPSKPPFNSSNNGQESNPNLLPVQSIIDKSHYENSEIDPTPNADDQDTKKRKGSPTINVRDETPTEPSTIDASSGTNKIIATEDNTKKNRPDEQQNTSKASAAGLGSSQKKIKNEVKKD